MHVDVIARRVRDDVANESLISRLASFAVHSSGHPEGDHRRPSNPRFPLMDVHHCDGGQATQTDVVTHIAAGRVEEPSELSLKMVCHPNHTAMLGNANAPHSTMMSPSVQPAPQWLDPLNTMMYIGGLEPCLRGTCRPHAK